MTSWSLFLWTHIVYKTSSIYRTYTYFFRSQFFFILAFEMKSVYAAYTCQYRVLLPWVRNIYINHWRVFCLRNLCVLSNLFLITYLCDHGVKDIYFILWVILYYEFIHLISQSVSTLSIGNFSGVLSYPFKTPTLFKIKIY